MAESCVIEVYENESFFRNRGWLSHHECPYTMKATMTPCKPIEEITVPSSEWGWATNWKITKVPGLTDGEGWEYASRFSRFKVQGRTPKSDPRWARARRRLWTRIMRRDPVVKTADLTKVLGKIQSGLSSVHSARTKIEEIMRQAPEAATSDQMKSLVASVERNISDILAVISQAEQQLQQNPQSGGGGGSGKTQASPAVLNKLRNEVLREQAAIERALDGLAPLTATGTTSAAALSRERSGSSFNVNSRTGGNIYAGSGGVLNGSFSSSYASGIHPNARGSFANAPTVHRGISNSFVGSVPQNGMVAGSNGSQYSAGNNGSERTSSTDLRDDLQGIQRMLPANSRGKPAVKSGSAKAFNPTIFSAGATNSAGEPTDGDFVDRTTQEMMIEQRLVAVDESTVMQEIIDDRHVEIQKVHKGLVELHEMFTDLGRMVQEQESEIGQIYGNIEESHAKTKEAFANVLEANRLQQSGNCVIS